MRDRGRPRFIDEAAAGHVRGQVGLQSVVQLSDKILVPMDALVGQRAEGGDVGLLTRHARLVGADADVHAAAHIVLGLVAMQRQCRPLRHRRVERGEIVLQSHFHAADQIVEHGNAVEVESDVKVDLRAQQQIGYRIHGEFAALRTAIAKAVGEADLRGAHAGAVAEHAEDGDGRHRVAVDADLRQCIRCGIDHQQTQKVRLGRRCGSR